MIYNEERNCYVLTKLEENCIKLHIENELLQKKLDIAVKALDFYKKDVCGEPYISRIATETLREIDLVEE